MNQPLKRFAVIGDPIAQSISPALQQAAIDATDLRHEYAAERVTPEQLPKVFSDLAKRYAGINVTRPLKEVVLPLLDDISPDAKIASSVNTITFDANGTAHGYSTDGGGLLAALRREHNQAITQAVVMGTGGAARAVAAALAETSSVTVVGRNRSAGQQLAQDLAAAGRTVTFVYTEPGAADQYRRLLEGCDLLVNATPLGGPDHLKESPLPARVLPSPDTVVFDLISIPRNTTFLRDAAAAHCKVIQGIEMLIEQGALSFTLWTGLNAPVDVMREAAYRAADLQPAAEATA